MSPLFLERCWRCYSRFLNGTKKRNTDTNTSASSSWELVQQRAGGLVKFLRDQTHRKLMYCPLQFNECSEFLIRTHNETLAISMPVRNPDRLAVRIHG